MRISVIIPAHNAARTLGRTLASLERQDVDEAYEVVVVDDGSEDETAAIAERSDGVRAVAHPQPLGPGPARNTGVEAARGSMLFFTDADCYPSPDWLRRGLEAIGTADLVQGAVRPDAAVSPEPFDRSVWVGSEFGLYETANLLVRREWFDRVGGFEDWLGARIGKPLAEDLWLGWRVRRAGGRTAFSDAALVEHAVFRRSPRAYVAERVRVTYFPDIVRKVPELRREFLFGRVFLNRRTAAFDLALAGVGVAAVAGSPLALVTAIPYVLMTARILRRWGRRGPLAATAEVVADVVGFGALLAGSVRARSVVL